MYEEREITLLADPTSYTGTPGEGFRVELITPVPSKIRARVPADMEETLEFHIQPVSVDRRAVTTFTVENGKLDEKAGMARIVLLKEHPFSVEVQLSLNISPERLTLDLNISAPPGQAARITLEDKTINIALAGPRELVQEAVTKPGAFHATVVIMPGDLESTGLKNLRRIHCVIVEPLYEKLTVFIMPDTAPENREVKVTISAASPK